MFEVIGLESVEAIFCQEIRESWHTKSCQVQVISLTINFHCSRPSFIFCFLILKNYSKSNNYSCGFARVQGNGLPLCKEVQKTIKQLREQINQCNKPMKSSKEPAYIGFASFTGLTIISFTNCIDSHQWWWVILGMTFFLKWLWKNILAVLTKKLWDKAVTFFLSKCVPDGQLCYYVGPPSSTFVPQS